MVVKQVVDVKTKATQQAPLLAQKSDMHEPHSYKYLKNEKSKDQKDFKAKKNYLSANNNSENRNEDQSSQALG